MVGDKTYLIMYLASPRGYPTLAKKTIRLDLADAAGYGAEMSGTFCPLPWIAVAMRNNGDLRVCAHSSNSVGKGIALKKNNSLFNASEDSLQDFRNAELLKSIRRSMLDGQWHENCVRCQKETEAGVRSRLQYEQDLRSDIITQEQAAILTAQDGTIDVGKVPLSLLDVRFGNQCNLACRTCNPSESNLWYTDHVALYGKTFQYGDRTLELKPQNNGRLGLDENFFAWYEKNTFNESLPELLKNVSQIHIAGGEPLKTKAHRDFLEKIIALGYQEKICIEYNTNGYVIPEVMWDIWSQFKQIKIGLSIDSIFSMNDYIRYPSKWSLLKSNMERFDQSGDKFIVWLALTVHCYNIFYLPEIIQWRVRSQFKKINNFSENMILSDHPLHNPKHLSIQILPGSVKEKIVEKFENFKKTIPALIQENQFMAAHPHESSAQIIRLLDSYSNLMMQNDLSQFFPKFIRYTENLDRIRDESFSEIFPEFKALLP